MRREWEIEDLIECWTLDEEELALLGAVRASGPSSGRGAAALLFHSA
ncbi:hypothetical protein [Nonomuraea jiangxiensis]|nr:hypothetical protein [Nonomuraea jiangxiensis]